MLFTTITGDGTAAKSHLIRRHWESAIQVFHKLFEGRSLRWRSVPAVPHHHISKQRMREMERESAHTNIQNNTSTHFVHININSHSSWVHVEGRSMRWPSFSSLNSSSTGTPGYGEPPRVKISQSSTPKDHLEQRKGDSTSFFTILCIFNSTKLRSGMFDLHITLVGVDSVKQCLWSHPLYWQTALQWTKASHFFEHGSIMLNFFFFFAFWFNSSADYKAIQDQEKQKLVVNLKHIQSIRTENQCCK